MLRIVSIGVYGYSEETFFAALQGADVDTFCDLRSRRGVRGPLYPFANHKRLEARLVGEGIRYVHLKELAPPKELRELQKRLDKAQGVQKRQRSALAPEFVAAYRERCLQGYSREQFLEAVGPEARVVALFCVEREPAACHRSIVAEWLASESGLQSVRHLRP